jgi:excisionase family DNA binding protein
LPSSGEASPESQFDAFGCPQGAVRRWPRAAAIGHDQPVTARFLTLADVAETLNVSGSQAYALVRSGALPAIKIGGRGQWRVEAQALEEFITSQYRQTAAFVRAHPFGDDT